MLAALYAIFKANADFPTAGLAAKITNSFFPKPLIKVSRCEYPVGNPVIESELPWLVWIFSPTTLADSLIETKSLTRLCSVIEFTLDSHSATKLLISVISLLS